MDEIIDLIIFDCDGVLIDSEIISANMLIHELEKIGINIDRSYVARHFLGRSYPTVFSTIRSDFGVELPASFEDQYRDQLLKAFDEGLEVITGVEQILREVKKPWCVATSSSLPRAEKSLELTGLRGLVGDRLFTASMVERGKPAPDLFFHAAKQMNAAPERCLVIEDSLNGIRAARAAGMRVWRFTGGSHMKGQHIDEADDIKSDLQFDDFSVFSTLIEQNLL
ncbi:HAD family hydrolase [Paenochrobactrum pullorum]|uniref:HAD family hydrolase n=1 Tax=Paenochrobactrum pullorum TaxID=1324351 RepID=UPI0035BC8029